MGFKGLKGVGIKAEIYIKFRKLATEEWSSVAC